jgi:hypothetical protein
LDFVASDLDFVAPDLDFVASRFDFVASGLEIRSRREHAASAPHRAAEKVARRDAREKRGWGGQAPCATTSTAMLPRVALL